jgi:hypothetical protein
MTEAAAIENNQCSYETNVKTGLQHGERSEKMKTINDNQPIYCQRSEAGEIMKRKKKACRSEYSMKAKSIQSISLNQQ